jgi:eukaryotic-like serine/threonine-protein kinase
MPLAPGTRLGPYEIDSSAGSGGMGEVYRARDTRLDRTVAVKVSRERFSERFEREARVIAGLNHPHICTLFDVGPDYLVMEYLEGQALRGPLPLKIALQYGAQAADALHAAHAKGVVHRDLKPGNILITKSGVKLLDFGLAKVAAQAATGEPGATQTIAEPLTRDNTILGTLQYMAPEQLEGRTADARSDIFAFGLVLYEAIAGKPAFQAASQASLIAAILKEEPRPLPEIAPVTPPALDRLVRKCLAKDPEARWQTAADLRDELLWIAEAPAASGQAQAGPTKSKTTAALAAIALAAGLAAGVLWQSSRQPASVAWTAIRLGGPPLAYAPRVSPDQQLIAFVDLVKGNAQIAVMRADGSSWTQLTRQNDTGYVSDLAWSPDGSQIYYSRFFDQARGVFAVPALGGESRLLVEDVNGPYPLPDGSMIVGKIATQGDYQLHRFWPDSGRIDALPGYFDANCDHPPVAVFPDGKEVAFWGVYSSAQDHKGTPGIWALDLESRKARQLGSTLGSWTSPYRAMSATPDGKSLITIANREDVIQVVKVPRGGGPDREVLFSIPSSLNIQTISTARDGSIYLDTWDRPMSVVRFSTAGGDPEELLQIDSNSRLVAPLAGPRLLLSSSGGGRLRLMSATPGGELRPLLPGNEQTGLPVAIAPNGLTAIGTGSGAQRQIAIASPREGRIVKRLALKASEARSLALSPDGKTLYYAAGGVVYAMAVDESKPASRIGEGDQLTIEPGGTYLYVKQATKNPSALVRLPLNGGPAEPIAMPPGIRMSPDWLSSLAVDAKGRLLFEIATPDSFFFSTGLYDPASRIVKKVPVRFEGDLWSMAWMADGSIVAGGARFASAIWRYHK